MSLYYVAITGKNYLFTRVVKPVSYSAVDINNMLRSVF